MGPRAVPAMSPEAIQELGSFTFDEAALAATGVTDRQLRNVPSGSSAVPPAEAAAPPSCRICHCEYRAGERLRQLPCGHVFHKECIDEWLGRSEGCAFCRRSIVPEK